MQAMTKMSSGTVAVVDGDSIEFLQEHDGKTYTSKRFVLRDNSLNDVKMGGWIGRRAQKAIDMAVAANAA